MTMTIPITAKPRKKPTWTISLFGLPPLDSSGGGGAALTEGVWVCQKRATITPYTPPLHDPCPLFLSLSLSLSIYLSIYLYKKLDFDLRRRSSKKGKRGYCVKKTKKNSLSLPAPLVTESLTLVIIVIILVNSHTNSPSL